MTDAPLPPGPELELSLDDIRGDRLEFLARMRATYGPAVRYFTQDWEAVFLSDPAAVEQVLAGNFRGYGKEGTPDLRMLKPMLGDGLLTSDGAAWRAQRHVLAPLFKRNSVEAWAPIVQRHTQAMLSRWRVAQGHPFEVGGAFSHLTLEIAAEALLGYRLDDDGGRFAQAVEILNESMGGAHAHDGAYQGYLTAGALAVVQDVVEQAIRARRADPASGAQDALALMMDAQDETGAALSERQLLDQGVTLLLAGHETTAKALSWAVYLLARHPDAARRLRDEARALPDDPSLSDLRRLPYTLAVLHEAMRLYSPIWVVSRIALAEDCVAGYRIPEGTLIPLSPFLMHRDPAAWDAPDAFRPERFLDEGTPQHPCQYIPFGAGPRQCIGRHFALMEMHLVLATLARHCTLDPLSDATVEAEALVTLRPKGGLWMTPHFHEVAHA